MRRWRRLTVHGDPRVFPTAVASQSQHLHGCWFAAAVVRKQDQVQYARALRRPAGWDECTREQREPGAGQEGAVARTCFSFVEVGFVPLRLLARRVLTEPLQAAPTV